MSRQREESVEFGEMYNALRVFYAAIDLQNPRLSVQKEQPRTAKISLTPKTNHKEVNISASVVSQVSMLEPFMQTQPNKFRKKAGSGSKRNLLDQFLVPKSILESNRVNITLELHPHSNLPHSQISVPPFVPKQTPKKFVDLNLFKKDKQKEKSWVVDENSKENQDINSNISRTHLRTSEAGDGELGIEEMLERGNVSPSESDDEEKGNPTTHLMNSEYFNLCQTYTSTQHDRTSLSAVQEQQIEESLIQSQIREQPSNPLPLPIPSPKMLSSLNPIPSLNNISQILNHNNISMEQQQQMIDLQKFIVGDLKEDIESLCYKLNQSGVVFEGEVGGEEGQDVEESEILESVKWRIQSLRKRILTDCPFLEQL